jgi:hypothetical protein
MKRLLIIGGSSVIAFLVVGVILVRAMGFEPRERSPGLWLSGEVVTTPVRDWSFTDEFEHLFVETRTWYFIPHSVTTYCTTYDGELYLTSTYPQAAEFPGNRSWNNNVVRDPHVRLKIGDRIYERQVFLVTDPAEKAAVLESKAEKYPDLRRAEDDRVHVLRTEPW